MSLDGVVLGSGQGRSRREAETRAAEVALEGLADEPMGEAVAE